MTTTPHKQSIANDYFYITAAGIAAVIALSIIFSVYIYLTEKKQLYHDLASAAIRVENIINQSFDYSTQLANAIGSQIAEEDIANKEKLAEIMSGKIISNSVAKNLFSYTIFDWITPDKKLVISGPYGVLKEPKDVSFRNYTKMAAKEPWTLYFDHPTYGIPSGNYTLPAGMGITDKHGKFLGILSLGFNLSNLSAAVTREIKEDGVKFLILSQQAGQIIFQSSDNISSQENILPNLPETVTKEQSNAKFLAQEISYDDVNYAYYRKFNKYPYMVLVGYNQKLLNKEIYTVLIPRIVELLCIGSISIILLLVTRRRIVAPLIRLSDVADQISQGITEIEIPKFQAFEMNVLAEQLTNVISYTKQLETNRMELESAKDKLELKVTERTDELEKALAAKTEFLNNMSHEIRTPVQGFTAISDGLIYHWDQFDDKKKLELASKVAHNARRLSSLVGNLLDISKFNAGKILLDLHKIDLNNLIADIIEECRTLYLNNKQIDINFHADIPIFIIADRERISQVLRNLFINSIKFSPNKSSVEVSLVPSEITYDDGNKSEALHFTIIDHGIGIPDNELITIFSPFTQSSITKTKAGGTGLGLSICKQIIEAHHGKIWADNNIGGGAVFNFVIPITQAATMDGHRIISDNDITTEPTPITSRPATILIIDDEDACLISMELLLFGTKYKLVKTGSGQAGLKYLIEHPGEVDAVLLDLMMPDMNGLNMLAEMKRNPALAQIPVIMQSGISDQSEITRAYNMGVFCFIKKPYQKQVVLSEVAKAVGIDDK